MNVESTTSGRPADLRFMRQYLSRVRVERSRTISYLLQERD